MLLWTFGCMYLVKLSIFVVFSDIHPGLELLGHMVLLLLDFWETSILLSIVTAPIYIPTNSVGGFPFLHTLTNICYLCSFGWESFWQMWGDIPLWFWFAFPWWLIMLSIFSCACWPPLLLGKMSIQFFDQFFNLFFFFDIELYELFIHARY